MITPFALALAITALPRPAHAGAQQYEPLADSVKSALTLAARGDRTPPEPIFRTPLEKVHWLTAMDERLPLRNKPEYQTRIEFLKTVHYEATRAGLDPQMVLGLIQVESGFKKYAVSSAGARGYMQIMPFWADLIGNGKAASLFEMSVNIRMGCVILRHYLDVENGDLYMALGRYNGSRGRPEYPNAVTAAWKKNWAWVPEKLPPPIPPATPAGKPEVKAAPPSPPPTYKPTKH
ncbi:MAG TPA: lytic transglycosylase domain-containing protein [Burkholderiales bacterium]|nr:lytic transglycosylase domain-containing protein [Burkholderiales bacterium]